MISGNMISDNSSHVGSRLDQSDSESPAKKRWINACADRLTEAFVSHLGEAPAERYPCRSQTDANLP